MPDVLRGSEFIHQYVHSNDSTVTFSFQTVYHILTTHMNNVYWWMQHHHDWQLYIRKISLKCIINKSRCQHYNYPIITYLVSMFLNCAFYPTACVQLWNKCLNLLLFDALLLLLKPFHLYLHHGIFVDSPRSSVNSFFVMYS